MFARLQLGWDDLSGLNAMHKGLSRLEPRRVRLIGARALNRAGDQGRTQSVQALTEQTGLTSRYIRRQYKTGRANQGKLLYEVNAQGGDIALKHFDARETRRGVSANPFGHRRVFKGTFVKGGRFPARTVLNMGGQVFTRVSGVRLPIEKQMSGVVLPEQMIVGASKQAWLSTVDRVLPSRFEHELERETGGIFSK